MKAINQRENGGASVRDSASDYGFKQSGSWTFHDKNVADNFDNEVHGHVAGYGVVIRLCAELSLRIHGPQKRVLSYWCGIGNQFEQYLKRGWSPEMIEGMNYSAPLRDRCVEASHEYVELLFVPLLLWQREWVLPRRATSTSYCSRVTKKCIQ